MMDEPLAKMTFRDVDGKYIRVDSQNIKPPTLADVLQNLNIIIDDKTEYARMYDYDNMLYIKYLKYGGKTTITIWKITNE